MIFSSRYLSPNYSFIGDVLRMDSIPSGGIIGEIFGEFMPPDHASSYTIDLEDGCVMEPVAPFRYLNHCCEPNCEFDWSMDIDEKYQIERRHLWLSALTDIEADSELTIDYNWPLEAAILCFCNHENCRGIIASLDELDEIIEE